MLLADIVWLDWEPHVTNRRWCKFAEFIRPCGKVLRIWEGFFNGRTEYCVYWDYKPPGIAERDDDAWRSELDALEAQCLLFHYLGGNDDLPT